jgi:hypothetical protein
MWFRWWEGTGTDPKFGVVAKKSGQSVAVVLAVWALLLENASETQCNAKQRGEISGFDFEAVDSLLGIGEGASEKVFAELGAKGMVDGNKIANWGKRQPKKEDPTNTGRSRKHRENAKTRGNAEQRDETQCNAMQRGETSGNAIQDKSIQDKNIKTKNKESTALGLSAEHESPEGAEPPGGETETPAPCLASGVTAAWNAILAPLGFRAARKPSPARKRHLGARARDDPERQSLAWWESLFERMGQSAWMRGKAQAGAKWLDLDWALNETNLAKILEGKYDGGVEGGGGDGEGGFCFAVPEDEEWAANIRRLRGEKERLMGEIVQSGKPPDPAMLARVKEIAAALGAQPGKGEEYGQAG